MLFESDDEESFCDCAVHLALDAFAVPTEEQGSIDMSNDPLGVLYNEALSEIRETLDLYEADMRKRMRLCLWPFVQSMLHLLRSLTPSSKIASLHLNLTTAFRSITTQSIDPSDAADTGTKGVYQHAIAAKVAMFLNQRKALVECIRFVHDRALAMLNKSTAMLRSALKQADSSHHHSHDKSWTTEAKQALELREQVYLSCCKVFEEVVVNAVKRRRVMTKAQEADTVERERCAETDAVVALEECFDATAPLVDLAVSLHEDGFPPPEFAERFVRQWQFVLEECKRLKHASVPQWLKLLELEKYSLAICNNSDCGKHSSLASVSPATPVSADARPTNSTTPATHTNKFHRCSVCKRVMYCDAQCQLRDWPQHKLSCKLHKPFVACDLRLKAFD